MRNLFITHKEELKELVHYGMLKAEVLENPGLYNGRLGMAILFYEYSVYCNDLLYEQFADEIIDSVLELPDNLSLNFSDGLLGIKWGMIYLSKRGFVEGDMKEVLSDIDSRINRLSLSGFNENFSACGDMCDDKIYREDEILGNIWKSCLYDVF